VRRSPQRVLEGCFEYSIFKELSRILVINWTFFNSCVINVLWGEKQLAVRPLTITQNSG
jgi:hypothetical protein